MTNKKQLNKNRRKAIFSKLVSGAPVSKIAKEFGISEKTVKRYKKEIPSDLNSTQFRTGDKCFNSKSYYNINKNKSQVNDSNVINVDGKRFFIEPDTGRIRKVLVDVSFTGREKRWRDYKQQNLAVERVYRTLSNGVDGKYWEKRANRLYVCGTHIYFDVYENNNGKEIMKVRRTESCRVRLCPLCTWRRSIKIQVHTRKILECMQQEKEYGYILLTLTVPNVSGENLSDTLTNMMKAWDRFQHYVKFKNAVKGWYRGLEITHNVNKNSNSYDTYHPHFHCILAVNKSYFTNNNNYINHDVWLSMWQRAMRNKNITQVDVRRVKSKSGTANTGDMIITAVCEVAKYTVKSSDYILPKDWKMSCNAVRVLDKALANRRLVAYGGIMKYWHKKLNLDDEIDGDLTEDETEIYGKVKRHVCAVWDVGYQQYFIHDN